MVLLAQDLLAWTAFVCLDGALAKAEPATLRYQLLHVAARLVRRGRDLHLRIDAAWPWRHHQDNPVDWYPWGSEAFARAQAEDKALLLSVLLRLPPGAT